MPWSARDFVGTGSRSSGWLCSTVGLPWAIREPPDDRSESFLQRSGLHVGEDLMQKRRVVPTVAHVSGSSGSVFGSYSTWEARANQGHELVDGDCVTKGKIHQALPTESAAKRIVNDRDDGIDVGEVTGLFAIPSTRSISPFSAAHTNFGMTAA